MLCHRAAMSGGLFRMTNQGNDPSFARSLSRTGVDVAAGSRSASALRNARLS